MTKAASLDIIAPPAYEGKDKTKLYLVAFSVVAVAILVGFFGVFYLLISSPASSVVNTITNEVPKKERELSYHLGDGVQHYERMTVEGDVLTVQAVGDGFIAIFDQGRGIVTLKNTTSGVCYMTRIDNVPEMDLDDMDDLLPVFFNETSTSELPTDGNVIVLTFDPSASIPTEYLAVTNSDIVTGQCMDGTYWVNPKDGKMAKRDILLAIALTLVVSEWLHHH